MTTRDKPFVPVWVPFIERDLGRVIRVSEVEPHFEQFCFDLWVSFAFLAIARRDSPLSYQC